MQEEEISLELLSSADRKSLETAVIEVLTRTVMYGSCQLRFYLDPKTDAIHYYYYDDSPNK